MSCTHRYMYLMNLYTYMHKHTHRTANQFTYAYRCMRIRAVKEQTKYNKQR